MTGVSMNKGKVNKLLKTKKGRKRLAKLMTSPLRTTLDYYHYLFDWRFYE
jgi:hypothetical protein